MKEPIIKNKNSGRPSLATSVAKTALDALQAKVSAIKFGYQAIRKNHNGELYKRLLNEMNVGLVGSSQSIKRQSPLVNAGYTLRLATLSKTIYDFVKCNSKSSGVNVVITGSGLDVLSIWARSLRKNVNIYEVDCHENCTLKIQCLQQSGLVVKPRCIYYDSGEDKIETATTSEGSECSEKFIFKGYINESKFAIDFKNTHGDMLFGTSNITPNYTLVSADLRCTSSLGKAFAASSFDGSLPTIVISELVLAYVRKQNLLDLLSFLSSKICYNEESIFIAYEPVWPSTSESHVVRSYAKEYFDKFTAKLNKGNSDQQKQKPLQFEPIGESSEHVIEMMRLCNFDGPVDCKKIISASRNLNLSHINLSPELFDEHAAFRLHMHCYCIIGAKVVSKDKKQMSNYFKLCPWTNIDDATLGFGRCLQPVNSIDPSDNLTISVIRKEHQEQVRILFTNMYNDLYTEYPAVKKMVKTAMKSDLNTKVCTKKCIKKISGLDNSKCAIWHYYSQHGGSFWVALDQEDSNRVIGCIGVTRIVKGGDLFTDRKYEIHRLAVHHDARGKGVGRQLLQTAENFISCKEYSGSATLFATTPEVLDTANLFYSSNAYEKVDDKLMGEMNIRTYKKVIPNK